MLGIKRTWILNTRTPTFYSPPGNIAATQIRNEICLISRIFKNMYIKHRNATAIPIILKTS